MADYEFTVTNWRARRYVISDNIASRASRIASAASGNTPRLTGLMAGSFRTVPGNDPGTTLVVNSAPHARYVEYGTRHMRAYAPLGRARGAGA